MTTSQKQLREQVEFMVAAVKLVVIDLPLNLAERQPAMADLVKHTKPDDWDFFATVAGVGAGVLEFPGEKSRAEGDTLTGLVMNSLNDWNTQAAGALADLMKFVRESVESGIPTEMAIGGWLLWNVKGDKPSDSEMEAAPGIGTFLRQAAKGCWS